MTICVFTGPTLSPQEGRIELDALYLPPVSQGDVYRAALRRPWAIGIIDGYFEHVPAVWHKEIIWAMTQGIHVYGSASIGALRAAELEPFGMEGVGAIFEAFRNGTLEDDDEVAVVHGPPETGYRVGSEAMVNIRRTLAVAEAANVVSFSTRIALEHIAKGLFYPERSYPLILQHGAEQGLPMAELRAFRAWLPHGQVDQKRADALVMLRVMSDRFKTSPESKRLHVTLEHTVFWDQAMRTAGVSDVDAEGNATTILLNALREELMLDGGAYARARKEAVVRNLSLSEAQRQGYVASASAVEEANDEFRRKHGLLDPKGFNRWLRENHLTWEQFDELMREEALLSLAQDRLQRDGLRRLLDHLRLTDGYSHLLERARDKQQTLGVYGLQNPGLKDADLSADALLEWYFEERLPRPIKEETEEYTAIAEFARDNVDAFMRAVLREFIYLRLKKQNTLDEASYQ